MEICEAYSGNCERIPETGTSTSTPKGPAELPLTGATYGDMLSVALVVILLGVILLLVAKRFFK